MLAKALELGVSDEEVVENAEKSEASDDDGIGFKKAEPETKRRRKGKQPEDPTAQSGQPSSAGTKGKAAADLLATVKSAEECISSLQSFSPTAYWQGSLKGKEVDKRLDVSLTLLNSQLQEHVETDEKIQEVSKRLSDAAQHVTDWMEILSPLKSSDTGTSYVQNMDKEDIAKFAQMLPADCMHSVLVDLGKRLWEEWKRKFWAWGGGS